MFQRPIKGSFRFPLVLAPSRSQQLLVCLTCTHTYTHWYRYKRLLQDIAVLGWLRAAIPTERLMPSAYRWLQRVGKSVPGVQCSHLAIEPSKNGKSSSRLRAKAIEAAGFFGRWHDRGKDRTASFLVTLHHWISLPSSLPLLSFRCDGCRCRQRSVVVRPWGGGCIGTWK